MSSFKIYKNNITPYKNHKGSLIVENRRVMSLMVAIGRNIKFYGSSVENCMYHKIIAFLPF